MYYSLDKLLSIDEQKIINESLILEFKVNYTIMDEIKKYVMSADFIDPVVKKKLLKLLEKNVISVGYDNVLLIRIFRALLRSIKLLLSSTISIGIRDSFALGYYNFRDHKIYILLDDLKVSKIDKDVLYFNILTTMVHEIVHYVHSEDFDEAEKIMYPTARDFYSTLIRRMNLWYPIKIDPVVGAEVISEFTNRFVKSVSTGSIKSTKDVLKLFDDIGKYKNNLSKGYTIGDMKEWMNNIYKNIFDNGRLIFTDQFRNSFLTTYSAVFKPSSLMLKHELNMINFYQELLTKSEIFAIASAGLLINGGISRNISPIKKLISLA